MKKFIILITVCLMTFISLFSSACGCSKDENQSGGSGEGSKITNTLFTRGVHVHDYSDTDNYLIKNGKTDYKILIPTSPSKYIIDAVKDFRELFYEATGIDIPVVYDNEVYLDINSTFISVGNNEIFKQTGITTDKYNLDKHGYIIKTFYKSIFIVGNTDRANMYGMYALLEYEFNFDCFSNTSYYIDSNVSEMKLKNYNVVDVPDMKNRAGGDSFILNFSTTMNRMRLLGRDEESFLGSASAHTFFYHVPKATYNDPEKIDTYHPEWYTSDGTQLCLTAHGDEESRQQLLNVVFESFKYEVSHNDKGYMFIFSTEDNGAWCSCPACLASKQQYNANSALIVKFLNELAEKVRQWFAGDGAEYSREFYLLFLGYQHTEEPPVIYDQATNTYTPVDSSVVCDKNVSVVVALGSFDYQNSIFHEVNAGFMRNFEGWKVISERINVYKYKSNFRNFMIPYDTFGTMQEFYQYAADANTYWIFDEGQRSHTAGATGWQVLKSYLCAKLSWDSNADMEELTDRYFDKYFGPASKDMRKMYDEYRIHSRDLINNRGWTRTNSMYLTSLNVQYWSKQLLDRWYSYIVDAIQSIEYLKKVNPVKYQEYYDHIAMERVSVYYLMVNLYGKGTRYAQSFIENISKEMQEDCKRLGIAADLGVI